jgi:3-dehydroquinate synthase
MVFVAELARLAGRLDDADVARHRRCSRRSGCRRRTPATVWDSCWPRCAVDKKSRGDLLRFVVLEGLGRPVMLEGPDPRPSAHACEGLRDALLEAYDAVRRAR